MLRLSRARIRGSCSWHGRLSALQPSQRAGVGAAGSGRAARLLSSSASRGGSAVIGGVEVPRSDHGDRMLVPKGYLRYLDESAVEDLRWMAQKWLLGQDMFLIGPPDPYRRRLAMAFAELLNAEVEYVPLSRDTTESDLKQRRELIQGNALHIDQAPVRAALHGRLLILDGLQNAERNVLPTLNNLLENREMTLDDGRSLISHRVYDSLLESGHTKESLAARGILRVHPDFRVIAIGSPVPPFQGQPLDPPLRSRFQSRLLDTPRTEEALSMLESMHPSLFRDRKGKEKVQQLMSVYEALRNAQLRKQDNSMKGFPLLTRSTLQTTAALMDRFPRLGVEEALHVTAPYTGSLRACISKDMTTMVDTIVPRVESSSSKASLPVLRAAQEPGVLEYESPSGPVPVATGSATPASADQFRTLLPTQLSALNGMLECHHLGQDVCVCGPKGSGKSVVVRAFAQLLGYQVHTFPLYSELTTRDLLQRRITDNAGNTSWQDSPLIAAARTGGLCVLDGVDKLDANVLASLQRLLSDKAVDLPDGTRLTAESEQGGIHPAFRVIGIAQAPKSPSEGKWASHEVSQMFLYVDLPPPSAAQLRNLVDSIEELRSVPAEVKQQLFKFYHHLEQNQAHLEDANKVTLSLRNILRILRQMAAALNTPESSLSYLLDNVMLVPFLPSNMQTIIADAKTAAGISSSGTVALPALDPPSISKDGKMLTIGGVEAPRLQASRPELVPNPVFYDNPTQTRLMSKMLAAYKLEEMGLLLIGNQGVGKNKLADRLIHLLGAEREYMQLHRDSTVQSLTLVPSLVDGKIVYEDSPLVRAAKTGRIAVIDEADKAPLEVVGLIKSLVEDGEMLLYNGKRLLTSKRLKEYARDGGALPDNIIPVADGFKVWVLANRPGFPFLGNNFFRECGDVFACHVIDNPDQRSEVALLSLYAPSVPTELIHALAAAFQDMRQLHAKGLIVYPYSVREAVAVARHLEKFPDDGVINALENVLAFEDYSPKTREKLAEVFQKHGIPIPASRREASAGLAVRVVEPVSLPSPTFLALPAQRRPVNVTVEELPCRGATWRTRIADGTYASVSSRLGSFQEEKARIHLSTLSRHPLHVRAALSSTDADMLFVLNSEPLQLYSLQSISKGRGTYTCTELSSNGWYANHGRGAPPVAVVHPNGDARVAVLVPQLDAVLVVDPTGRMPTRSLPVPQLPRSSEPQSSSWMSSWTRKSAQRSSSWQLMSSSQSPTAVLLWHPESTSLYELDVEQQRMLSINVDIAGPIQQVYDASGNVIIRTDSAVYRLQRQPDGAVTVEQLTDAPISSAVTGVPEESGVSLEATIDHAFQALALADPASSESHQLRQWGRDGAAALGNDARIILSQHVGGRKYVNLASASNDAGDQRKFVSEVLEVDAASGTVQYKQLELPKHPALPVAAVPTAPQGLQFCVAYEDGTLALFDADQEILRKEQRKWEQMFGMRKDQGGIFIKQTASSRPQQLQLTSKPRTKAGAPKHGKEDPTNAPHVGGNTWAGGTGGSDTAGLGGRGGPYRLDKGHNVHQISDDEKAMVSEEAKRRAREMGQAALKKRLEEIGLQEYENSAYEEYLGRVDTQIQQLRVILDSIESKDNERVWLRHQTQGELDDTKLVDGLTGDRLVFKRRGDSNDRSHASFNPQKKKRLLFVMDVSGSMYRFNSYDGRLERMLEATMMVMEALDGYSNKIDYAIVGHSGDSPEIPFVQFGKPPGNRKHKMDVLQKMVAHSQFCMSGDHTVEAMEKAIQRVVQGEESDQNIVVVVSDANFERYGITPHDIGSIMRSNHEVACHLVMIASLEDEAEELRAELPKGSAHICYRTADLPQAFKAILTEAGGALDTSR